MASRLIVVYRVRDRWDAPSRALCVDMLHLHVDRRGAALHGPGGEEDRGGVEGGALLSGDG
jgi:hypothetical protein